MWKEIGAGNLRILDKLDEKSKKVASSRIVGRMAGSMRLIINVKIWGGMVITKTSAKTIRFTAVESDKALNSYLISTSVQDIDSLFDMLKRRVDSMKEASQT